MIKEKMIKIYLSFAVDGVIMDVVERVERNQKLQYGGDNKYGKRNKGLLKRD